VTKVYMEYLSFFQFFSNVTNHSVLGSRFRKNGGSNRKVVADTSILGKGCGVDPAMVPP